MAKLTKKDHGIAAGSRVGAPRDVGDTTAANPHRDRIAQRAYELYLQRGAADGAAMDDWLNAERELTAGAGERGQDS